MVEQQTRLGSKADRSPKSAPASRTDRGDSVVPIVALGASAGGLEQLQKFFSSLSSQSGAAFVVIQHLDPDRDSMIASILGRRTDMHVGQVEEGETPAADRVYVAPPGRLLSLKKGRFHIRKPKDRMEARHPIDYFFRSMAAAVGEKAVAVILSGTGADGTGGLRDVKAQGGLVLVQDPEKAAYDGMPRAAMATGLVDRILDVEAMPAHLLRYLGHTYVRGEEPFDLDRPEATSGVQSVLDVLNTGSHYDFGAYKRSTLFRRIHRRMGLHQLDSLEAYVRLLSDKPAERSALARDLLISVTRFFRDAEAWKTLKQDVLLPLARERGEGETVRVWVPGCATGEEAYTMAILLLEARKEAQSPCDIQIFASDVDADALAVARPGTYPVVRAAEVSPARRSRSFTRFDGGFRIKREVREKVVFAEQNLLSDPPFSRMDLVSCRNFLIYLVPEAQERLLRLFHYSLSPGGCLFLGNAETTSTGEALFEPLSKRYRIFRKVGTTRLSHVDFRSFSKPPIPRSQLRNGLRGRDHDIFVEAIKKLVLNRFAPPSVVVNGRDEILFSFGAASPYLTPPRGAMTTDLFAWTPLTTHPKLRATLLKARRTGKPIARGPFEVPGQGGGHAFRIVVDPLTLPNSVEGLLLVSFSEVVPAGIAALPAMDPDPGEIAIIDHLEEQLREARSELQISVEELETSNEELRTANEEMTSMNEDLQSTNEELETSGEELQSLIDELAAVNSKLQEKVVALETANNDLANLISSSGIPTVFLDPSLCIKWFTESAGEFLHLRPLDFHRSIRELSLPAAGANMEADARRVMETRVQLESQIRCEDGRWYIRRVLPYRISGDRVDGVVVAFIEMTELKAAEEALRTLNEQLDARVHERTHYLELLGRIAVIANQADSIQKAFPAVLKEMCAGFDWPVGHAYLHSMKDPLVLEDSGAWWFGEPELESLKMHAAARKPRKGKDRGPLGEEMEEVRPTWTTDLDAISTYPADVLRRAGIRGAVTVPIVVGRRRVGVLKFLSRGDSEPDALLLDTASLCGTQLGRVVVRKELEREELERQTADLVVEEHRRLGQELHDTLAQQIVGAALLAETLHRRIKEALPPEAVLAQRLAASLTEAKQQVHDLARGLMPVEVDAAGLMSALDDLVSRLRSSFRSNCRFECARPVLVEDNFTATHLFYIAQEALYNAVKHSGAPEIVVSLAAEGIDLVLEVRDDGAGKFEVPDETRGLGIRIMRYRSGLIGGSLTFESAPGGGLIVRCALRGGAAA